MRDNQGHIRPYEATDETAVVGVWHRAGLAAYPYLPTWQSFTLEKAHEVFRQFIQPNCDIWVGTVDREVVAYLAMAGSCLDRLYVDPAAQGQGWGSRFVELAKRHCPDGLELYTHQQNETARAFYEKRGFVAVKFGISPPPESAPDVLYQWRPAGGKVSDTFAGDTYLTEV